MKHLIRIPVSFAAIVAITVALAMVNPTSEGGVSLTSHVEAVQPTQKIEPVNNPAPAPAAQEAAPAPVSQPIVPTYPTDHVAIMQAAGIDPGDYAAVDGIISHESGWCPTKSEGEYGACPAYHGYSSAGYGLCQSTPANKMAIMGNGWEQDPVLQLKWCTIHADGYGGWQAAWAHWQYQVTHIGHGNW